MQVEHKQLSSAWRKILQAIQARVIAELGSLPASLQPEEGKATDYAAAKHIRDTLAETANNSLLGGLKGTAGLWDKIVKAYQARSELIQNMSMCYVSAVPQKVINSSPRAVACTWLSDVSNTKSRLDYSPRHLACL